MMATPVAEGFVWRDGPGGRVLAATALERLAAHAFTTRHFGKTFETGGQLTVLAQHFGVAPDHLVRVRQVHGCRAWMVSPEMPVADDVSADALVLTDVRRVVAVAVADCVPILVADRHARGVAAIHAGWRGTAAGIAGQVVEALGQLGIAPHDLVAAIGPSIGPCCYQVDEPVRDAFAGVESAGAWFMPDGPRRWKLDLWSANVDQLVRAGLRRDTVHVARVCTAEAVDDCASYRRDGAAAGRMFAAIRLGPSIPS